MFKYLYQKLFSKEIETVDYMVPGLEDHCILFGSRLWGGATEKSDVDLIAHVRELADIEYVLTYNNIGYKIKKGTYDTVPKEINFSLNGYKYQLSLIEFSKDYEIWKTSINVMTNMSEDSNYRKKFMKSRDIRADYCERLCTFVNLGDSKVLPSKALKFIEDNHPELLI